jgi:glycosyltransferase involved in cell wall biosynthesis
MPRDVIALLPHVVIADEGELNSYYAAIAERRLVWVIHDLHGYHFPDQWRKEHLALMRRRFRLLSKRVTWVIVHNEFTADDVVEKLAISREKISIVGLPALISREEHASTIEPDTEVLARHRITQPYALWASSSTFSHKNHERLLEAWSILSDRGHGLQLVCTGARGPRWEQVSARIASLRLEDSVCFTDNISDADMAAILRNAHLAVCPTLFEGGGPVPAAEAVMASIPVAASDIPQVRQLFDDREDLISFFDPMRPEAIAAAVEQIVVDYETVKRRADFARSEYGRMRTWEKTAKAYWNAIERAVSAEA